MLVLSQIIVVVALGIAIFFGLRRRRRSRRRGSRDGHAWRQESARRALGVLRTIEEPSKKFAYLRKVDAFVFEELLLEACERSGHRIQRNRRYTGDGGVDGRVWIEGRLHLIQAKRYSGPVRAEHVEELGALARQSGCRALLIHTGRTGPATRAALQRWPQVDLISGDRLLALLEGKLGNK